MMQETESILSKCLWVERVGYMKKINIPIIIKRNQEEEMFRDMSGYDQKNKTSSTRKPKTNKTSNEATTSSI